MTKSEEPEFLDWQKICEAQGDRHPERCPVCGKRLVVLGLVPRLKSTNESGILDVPVELFRLAA